MATAAEEDNPVNLWPYVLQLSLVYIIAAVVVGTIQHVVDMEPNIAIGMVSCSRLPLCRYESSCLIITGRLSGASSFALRFLRSSPSLL